MCLKPVQTNIRNIVTGSTRKQAVPCGKCIECVKRKQNDYAFLMSQHAINHSKLDFVTLTYRDSAIPFSGVFEVFNRNSGEVLEKSGLFWLKPEWHETVRREYYMNDAPSGHQMQVPFEYLDGLDDYRIEHHVGVFFGTEIDLRYSPVAVFGAKVGRVPSDCDVRTVVTASLRRQDVKLCLKNARVRFKRLYGYNAEFTYFEVGEYGCKRHRPHYHILFFDAPDTFLELFRSMWFNSYGSTDYEPVVARGTDSLDVAHEKVSRYLAKYLSKGMFEADFVRLGYVQRPRRVSSKGIAKDRLPALRKYILAFDVFGEYDPDCPPSSVMRRLDLLAERRYYQIIRNGTIFKLKIPKVLYDKCLSKTYGLSKDARKKLGFSRSKDPSPILRLSHQRTFLHRALLDYSKKHYQDLLDKIVFQASNGRTKRPSSLSFRFAYASLSGSVQEVRQKNAASSWTQLSNFYSRSRD